MRFGRRPGHVGLTGRSKSLARERRYCFNRHPISAQFERARSVSWTNFEPVLSYSTSKELGNPADRKASGLACTDRSRDLSYSSTSKEKQIPHCATLRSE